MSRLFTGLTLSGPVFGAGGVYFNLPLLFWLGTGLASMNLFMNLASGAMRLPVLPAAFVLAGSFFWSPWYLGAAFGLLAWTACESASEIIAAVKSRAS